MSDLVERLREATSAGYDEWRVQDPKDGAYCMSYSWPYSHHPELEARQWLATFNTKYPKGRYADYVVACVRVVPTKDRLLAEAADEITRLRAQVAALSAPAPAPLLVRDLAATLKVEPLDLCRTLEALGYGPHSVNMAVPAAAVGAVEKHFAQAAQAAQAAPAPAPAEAPTIEAAHAMGAKGGPVVEAERLAFEAWMRGHCWALSATWTGTQYRSDAEQGGDKGRGRLGGDEDVRPGGRSGLR